MSQQTSVLTRLSRLVDKTTELDMTPPPVRSLERRLAPRRFCNIAGQCSTLRNPDKAFAVTIQDISLGGIGFITGHAIGRGETLRVTFQVNGVCLTRMARTKHVRLEDDGQHFHGCSLLLPLDADTFGVAPAGTEPRVARSARTSGGLQVGL